MSMEWKGLEWAGCTVVVMASGPSLTAEQADQVRRWRAGRDDRRVVAINSTYRRALWADVLYACDCPWWTQYHAEVVRSGFAGEMWTQDALAQERFGVKRIESAPNPGLGRRPGIIHQGQNGGYQAVNLVYQAGASRIMLLGFDMKGGHWHGDHPKPLTNTQPYLFAAYIRHFDKLAQDLHAVGVDVVNCTPDSALKCFPAMSLDVALAAEALIA